MKCNHDADKEFCDNCQKDETIQQQAEQIAQLRKAREEMRNIAEPLIEENKRLKEENHELLLADTKNTEIVERLMKEAEGVSEDAWDSLKHKINQLEAQLIQANLDIIRLEKRNDTLHEDYDVMAEVISSQAEEGNYLREEQAHNLNEITRLKEELRIQTVQANRYNAEITRLKSNQSKFSG